MNNNLRKLLEVIEPKIQNIEENRVENAALKKVSETMKELVGIGSSYKEVFAFYDQEFIFKAIKIGNSNADDLIKRYQSAKYLLQNDNEDLQEMPQFKEAINFMEELYQYLCGLKEKITSDYETKNENLEIQEILNKYYGLLNRNDIFIKDIDDFYAGHGASYVGNKGDYERWAREIDGVGYAHCIPCAPMWSIFFKVRDANDNPVQGTLEVRAGDSPNEIKIVDLSSSNENPHTLTGTLAYDGVNSVRLVIADGNGDPANSALLKEVETYIFGTGHDDIKRLAPIGVSKYEVVAPTPKILSLELDVQYATGATKSKVQSRIVKTMMNFIQTLSDDDNFYGEIKYSKVAALMSGVAGIEDFRNLKLNGGTINVAFLQDEVPFIDEEHVTINRW